MVNKPLIIGHRGAPEEAPENTIASFQKAIEIGVDGVELDLHRIKDDQLIVVHNAEFSLEGQATQYVFDYTYEDLHELLPEIPLFQAVFDLCRGKITIQAEIKRQDRKTVELCLAMIEKNQFESEIELTSSHPTVLAEVKRINPKVRTGLLLEPFPEWMLGKHQIVSVLDAMSIIGADVVHIRLPLLTEPLVRAIKEKGYTLHSGQAESEDDLRAVVQLGVDQITTNDPLAAVSFYNAN